MNSKKENLGSLAYTMSDEEILEISHNIHVKYILDKDISEEERDRLISIIPMTTKEIDFFVACGKSREELEAENRKILAKRAWEKYLS